MSRHLLSAPEPLCRTYDVALLDLDGVVYRGDHAVPHASDSLAAAASAGMRLAFVTNNAARTPGMVAAHLRALGVPAHDAQVVTSAQAAARLVRERVPEGSRVLVVGGEGLVAALQELGLVPVHSADAHPVAVVQGFAPDLAWRQLAEGAYALATGIPWVASNADLTIPTARGIAPGNGTFVEALQHATGRTPVVAGKPELPLHAEALRRSGARNPLVVGDRLDTDIEGAVRAGTPSLLVLTGVTRAADLLTAPEHLRPSYLAADLRGLLEPHEAPCPREDADGNRDEPAMALGGWHARVDRDGTLHVSGAGTPLDALRVACSAAWSAPQLPRWVDAPSESELPTDLPANTPPAAGARRPGPVGAEQ